MSTTPVKFSGFEDMAAYLSEQNEKLWNKSKETELLSYLFRRIPLIFGAFLTFFLLCLLVSLCKGIALTSINQWLQSLQSCFIYHKTWFFVILGFNVFCAFFCHVGAPVNSWKFWRKKIKVVIVPFLIQLVAMLCFIFSLAAVQPLIAGAVIMGTVTVTSMLINRTLGFTRRYERYRFFSTRAKQLAIQFRTLEEMEITCTELHVRELAALFEALASSKHNATVGDSFYLLKQLEKRVAEL